MNVTQASLKQFKPMRRKTGKLAAYEMATAGPPPTQQPPPAVVGPKPQTTIQETEREGTAGSWITAARKSRHLTFLVKSSKYRDYYYEVQSTPKGLRCGGTRGPCKAWQSFLDGNIKDPCRHVLIVKDRLARGLVKYKGRAITSLKAFRELLTSGMHATDMSAMWGLIYKYPDRTAIELCLIWNAKLKKEGQPGKRTSTAAARVSELAANGMINASGTKLNPDSEEPANTWRVAWGCG